MRLNELIGKEVIDINGTRLGKIRKADIILEIDGGNVESIILEKWNDKIIIPWHGIKQIGERIVIIDSNIIYQ